MSYFNLSSLLLLSLLCTSCQYNWSTTARDLSLTYVQGDARGDITSALARALQTSFEIQDDSAYLVKVAIVQERDETIGYSRSGSKLSDDEGRKHIEANVWLYSKGSDKPLLGPISVKATMDYDYGSGELLKASVREFSLGQLNNKEAASESAKAPLYDLLAQRIVSALELHWPAE